MWARIAAYAAVGFAAACLWLFLGSSPASADDSQPTLLDSVGSLTTTATQPVTDLAQQTLQQVGEVEQQTTETVRQVAAQTGVQPVRDVVDQTTRTVDDQVAAVTEQVAEVAPPPAAEQPRDPQAHQPDADLVQRAQQLRAEMPASHRSATRAVPAHPHHPPVEAAPAHTSSEVSAPVAALVPQAAAPADPQRVPDLGSTPEPAPDGTAPTGGSASGAAAAVPSSTVRLPQTAAVTVTDVALMAPRPPTFSPGFSPD